MATLLMTVAATLAGTVTSRAANVIFIPLLNGAEFGVGGPSALSPDGFTVVGLGGGLVNSVTHDQAWIWTQSGGTVGLGFVTGFNSANYATSVSSNGPVVVGTGIGSAGTQGFLRTANGGIVGLGVAPGDVGNVVDGVSADGSTVVGGHASNTSAGAFYWTQAAGFVNIGTLPGDNLANGVAASADGSVIVGISGNTSTGVTQAFIWTAAGGMVGLGTLPGDTSSMANAVSQDGSAVVGVSSNASTGAIHAFRWTSATGMVNLGLLPGETIASAWATNQDGSVVVGQTSGDDAIDGGGQAFIWTAAGGLQDFYGYFLNSGGTVQGQTFFASAIGISADGKVVLGQGTDSFGDPATYLASLEPSPLVAAVLPASRSVQVGRTATAFATIINAGGSNVSACAIAPQTSVPATFLYQTTNPATNALTGTANTPANIAQGASQSFLLALTPTAAFAPTDVAFNFACANASAAAVLPGINTLELTASATAVPDVVALAASGDPGYVDIPGATGAGDFAVATVNLGVDATITASANTGSATLPVTLTLCQTNPTSGACMAAPAASVTTDIQPNATPTFGIFAAGSASVADSPGTNRIFVTFTDSGGVLRGETSVAVRTQ